MNYNMIYMILLCSLFYVKSNASVFDIFMSATTPKEDYISDNLNFFLSDSSFDHFIGKELSGRNVTLVEWVFACMFDILNE